MTVDTTTPTITIISPTNGTNTTNTLLDVNYVATDTNRASCWFNDNNGTNTTLNNCANITNLVWGVGNHNFSLWTNDSAGNKIDGFVTFARRR